MKHLLRTLFLSLISLTAFATVHQVNSGMFYYTPSELTINVGDTVVWINDGGTHDVNGNINSITGNSFDNPESFDSPSTSTVGATIYTHVFNIEGTYNYDCSVGNHALQGM
ncbi:MAG: cupredoxin domain-containing protein, partial [Flavobacteriales bacterium]